MKVLLIDPWGINNTAEYLNGLIFGVSKLVELTVATNYYFSLETDSKCKVEHIFFKHSEKMKKNILRTIIRAIEYFCAYLRILRIVKYGGFDIVHFNWLLNYNQDAFFIKRIKRIKGIKIVYTAHNVLPHTKKRSIAKLRDIYAIVDTIILHGDSIFAEFKNLFPSLINKVYIQKHGCNLIPKTSFTDTLVDDVIKTKINSFDKIFIFFGAIFYNKGVDRLANYWIKNNPKALLIIGGRQTEPFAEFDSIKPELRSKSNVIFLDFFVEDNLLNYLIFHSDVIVLPYRHASMSGVVFTASDFKKTILFTDCGAIKEYLKPGSDSFICENDDLALEKAIDKVLILSREDLKKMGNLLSKNINDSCKWTDITKDMISHVYLKPENLSQNH